MGWLFDNRSEFFAMFELLQAIPFSFAALFPVLNPLGGAVIFLTLTYGMAETELPKLALKVGINTFVLLVVVLLTGSWILRMFGIDIGVVQVGGGLVVAYIGWTLLNQSTSTGATDTPPVRSEKDMNEMAFFPLTMPITAGPGCIAVTLTIGAHEVGKHITTTFMGQLGAIIGIFLASATVFLCYRYANRLTRTLGSTGKQVIMRISAFINLCIGLEIIWHGLQGLLQT